jgi:hypothetical protein
MTPRCCGGYRRLPLAIDPHITGYYIPDDPAQRRGPLPAKLVHQAQDVLVDRRGVIYLSEGNSGIYILRHQTS